MDFKAATDALFGRVTHEELAGELGVSVPTIRQARLSAKAKAHRTPPPGWEQAVKDLAEDRVRQYSRLVGELERAGKRGR